MADSHAQSQKGARAEAHIFAADYGLAETVKERFAGL